MQGNLLCRQALDLDRLLPQRIHKLEHKLPSIPNESLEKVSKLKNEIAYDPKSIVISGESKDRTEENTAQVSHTRIESSIKGTKSESTLLTLQQIHLKFPQYLD